MMNLNQEIKSANNIAIIGHIKPDGDCIGSVTALYQYIKQIDANKEVDMILDKFKNNYSFIPVINDIIESPKYNSYDLCFCMDCGALERLGRYGNIFTNAKKTVVFDHHITTEKFGDTLNLNYNSSSTCEYLYEFLDKDYITKDIATSLYTGLISDTGVFRYSCTSQKSFIMAAELLQKGINHSEIVEESYFSKTYISNKFMAACILNSKLLENDKIIYTVADKKLMKKYGIDKSEIEGIVESMRDTDTVEVSIFAYEIDENIYKISLRSKNYVDVSEVCSKFSGGGHVRAAGCTLRGNFKLLFNELLKEVKKRL